MKYLRKFNSHSEYASAEITTTPCVIYDEEEVHYLAELTNDEEDEEDEEPTDTTTIVE